MTESSHLARPGSWLPMVLLLALLAPCPIWAQDENSGDDGAAEDAGAGGETLGDDGSTTGGDLGAFGQESVDFGAVDELLEQDAEVMSDPGTYAYDPGARRDPFRSLIQRKADDRSDEDRPEGVAGLLVDEIAVQGIFLLPDGPVAQVVSTSQDTSFLIRPGDQLWDGEVVSMTLNEVVFKQDTDDQNSLKPFREVVKKLDPRA